MTAGVELFASALAAQAAPVTAVSWRPPPDGSLSALATVLALMVPSLAFLLRVSVYEETDPDTPSQPPAVMSIERPELIANVA